MRRASFFGGILIVLLGIVLLAINMGFVTSKIWSLFWPAVLILFGAWFIFGTHARQDALESVSRSITLFGDTEASIEFNYGAGLLSVGSSTTPNELLGGTFTGGLTDEINRADGKVFLKLSTPAEVIFPSSWVHGQQGLGWNVGLTREIPLKLHFHTGACEANLNLRELRVVDLILETGASKTTIQLPQNAGFTHVEVKTGASDVQIVVPQGVAATIKESSGLSGIKVDTNRFIQNGHTYESADYSTALNKVEIIYEGGMGSINIC